MSARIQFICRIIGSIKLFKNFSIGYFFPLHSICSTLLISSVPPPLSLSFLVLPEQITETDPAVQVSCFLILSPVSLMKFRIFWKFSLVKMQNVRDSHIVVEQRQILTLTFAVCFVLFLFWTGLFAQFMLISSIRSSCLPKCYSLLAWCLFGLFSRKTEWAACSGS